MVLRGLNPEGPTSIIVTHAAEAVAQTDRTVYLRDRQVVEERRSDRNPGG